MYEKMQIGYIFFSFTSEKMKFYIKDFFSKCEQIRSFLLIWSHLLKKSLMENLIFCAMDKRAVPPFIVRKEKTSIRPNKFASGKPP